MLLFGLLQVTDHNRYISPNYAGQELVVHQGEEFMLIIEGSLDVNFGDLKTYHMEKGDSIAFISKIPHKICSKKGAKVLIPSTTLPFSIFELRTQTMDGNRTLLR